MENVLLRGLLPPGVVCLTGATGQSYFYSECDLSLGFNPVPGNYAFLDAMNRPLYIGEAVNFQTRPLGTSHEKWPAALLYGAMKIVFRVNWCGEAVRKAEEKDLIRAYAPVLNTQHNPMASAVRGQQNPLLDIFAR